MISRNLEFEVMEVKMNTPQSVFVHAERRSGAKLQFETSISHQPKVGDAVYVTISSEKT
jgi:hypothetical protein